MNTTTATAARVTEYVEEARYAGHELAHEFEDYTDLAEDIALYNEYHTDPVADLDMELVTQLAKLAYAQSN